MTNPARRTVRHRWVVVIGVILWFVLASSITLEQGQEAVARWGSAAALALIGLLVLFVAARVALLPLRRGVRWVGRRAKKRFR